MSQNKKKKSFIKNKKRKMKKADEANMEKLGIQKKSSKKLNKTIDN